MTQDTILRVLHLTTAEEVFFTQQIEAIEQRGVECTVLSVPGIEQIDGNLAEKRGLKEYIQYLSMVRRELQRGDYDIIHANNGLTAPYAAMQFQLPTVLTLWGSDVIGFDGLVTKVCAWRFDAITVRSQEMRELLGHDDAIILPSGINLDRFKPIDKTKARTYVGWEQDQIHVLFPYAPDYKRKNYPLAERVVKRVEDELGTKIELQTISGVPHEDVAYYMNAADAVLLTSDHEGSPNTVKEAMACNVPVVSTDVGDVRERLLRVEPSAVGTEIDELVSGLTDVLRSGERSNGRKVVQEVSWDRIGGRILEIYNDVV